MVWKYFPRFQVPSGWIEFRLCLGVLGEEKKYLQYHNCLHIAFLHLPKMLIFIILDFLMVCGACPTAVMNAEKISLHSAQFEIPANCDFKIFQAHAAER